MKKLIYMTAALALTFSTATAQDEVLSESSSSSSNKSKNGHQITPQSGDIGLGFDARGLTTVFTVASVQNGFINNDQAIFGKYFLDDETAVRARVRIGQSTNTEMSSVFQDQQLDPDVMVEDKMVESFGDQVIGIGLEKRRGSHRIQGVYGAELGFFRTNLTRIYEYGNALDVNNQNPTTTNFGTGNIFSANERALEQHETTDFGVYLNAVIGAEYFIAPKLSVGGEFSWGFIYAKGGEGMEYTEEYNAQYDNHEYTTGNNGNKQMGVDTGNLNGAVYFMFYF